MSSVLRQVVSSCILFLHILSSTIYLLNNYRLSNPSNIANNRCYAPSLEVEYRNEVRNAEVMKVSENYINAINIIKSMKEFNIIIEQGEDGYLISEVVGLSGCHTQAKSFDELIERTKEAVSLCLKCQEEPISERFLGIQRIMV